MSKSNQSVQGPKIDGDFLPRVLGLSVLNRVMFSYPQAHPYHQTQTLIKYQHPPPGGGRGIQVNGKRQTPGSCFRVCGSAVYILDCKTVRILACVLWTHSLFFSPWVASLDLCVTHSRVTHRYLKDRTTEKREKKSLFCSLFTITYNSLNCKVCKQ